jgi:hypothetical protein
MTQNLVRALRSLTLLVSALALGTSYRTITIDGTNDFAADESVPASSAGGTWYFTWDADNLYIGANNPDVADAASSYKWVLVYIDSDPQPVPSAGAGTSLGVLYNTQQPALPFKADYHIRWKTNDTYIDLETFNGTSWVSGVQTGIQRSRSGNFVEFRIPRANIGSPGKIYVCAEMITEQPLSEWSYYLTPASHTDGYDVNFTHFFGFSLSTGIAPNDPGNVDQVLPVRLKSFAATVLDAGRVRLDWTTLSETNNYGFEVQKSASPGGAFQPVSGIIPGHQTTAVPRTYSFVDSSSLPGRLYRLRQIDLDQSCVYSECIEAQTTGVRQEQPGSFALGQNYPNPFNPVTTIEFRIDRPEHVALTVYDLLGQEVATLADETMPPGIHLLRFSAGGLASGIYLYRLRAGAYSETRKMVVTK